MAHKICQEALVHTAFDTMELADHADGKSSSAGYLCSAILQYAYGSSIACTLTADSNVPYCVRRLSSTSVQEATSRDKPPSGGQDFYDEKNFFTQKPASCVTSNTCRCCINTSINGKSRAIHIQYGIKLLRSVSQSVIPDAFKTHSCRMLSTRMKSTIPRFKPALDLDQSAKTCMVRSDTPTTDDAAVGSQSAGHAID